MHILPLTRSNALQIATLMNNGVSFGELMDMVMSDNDTKTKRLFICVDKKWAFVKEEKLKDLLAGVINFLE